MKAGKVNSKENEGGIEIVKKTKAGNGNSKEN
jgi:hypothetical protein